VIDDMRLMRHPAKWWEIEYKHGEVRGIEKCGASAELMREALAEVDALRTDQPAKPYQRRSGVVASR
jgi:hypothetical protein